MPIGPGWSYYMGPDYYTDYYMNRLVGIGDVFYSAPTTKKQRARETSTLRSSLAIVLSHFFTGAEQGARPDS